MVIITDHNQPNKTTGRRKIEIKKIEKQSHKQVTFSRRRNGLFKKASELCLLCGAEVAVIAFSPGGKAFAFGYPDVDAILHRYLGDNSEDIKGNTKETTKDPYIQLQKAMFEETLKALEEEKDQAARVEEWKKVKEDYGMFWWEEEIDNMGLEEVEGYIEAMQQLWMNVGIRVNNLMMMMGRLVNESACVGDHSGHCTDGGRRIRLHPFRNESVHHHNPSKIFNFLPEPD